MSAIVIFLVYLQLLVSGVVFINALGLVILALFISPLEDILWFAGLCSLSGLLTGLIALRIHKQEFILYYEVARIFYPIAFVSGTGATLGSAYFLWTNLEVAHENALIHVFTALTFAAFILIKWLEVRFLPELGDFEPGDKP